MEKPRFRFNPGTSILGTMSTHLFLAVISVFMLLPIYWSFVTSVTPEKSINRYPPSVIPKHFVMDHYIHAFQSQPMTRFIFNSFFVSISSSVIAVLISLLAAYTLSRYRFKGKTLLVLFVLFPMMMPGITNLIPLYNAFSAIGWINEYHGLIALYLPALLPFAIWLLKNFIDGVPYELEEASFVDGCNRYNVIYRIILPSAMPGIVAIAVINFVTVWNEFLISLLFTTEKSMRTMTVGIFNFIGFNNLQQGPINAAAISAMLPAVVIFLLVRERFMKSIIEGAVKG